MNKNEMINEICDKLTISRLETMHKMSLSDVQLLHSIIEELHDELEEIKRQLLIDEV